MEDKTSNSQSSEETTVQVQTSSAPAAKSAPEQEHRQAYGTAKTENLRDSGLWRAILPTAVTLFCLALFVIPLIILIPLLFNSIDGLKNNNAGEAQLLWVWITMIVIEVSVGILIARGLLRIFWTQAGNYSRA